jgi:predicted XRE-type DNA-binding protein
MPAACSQLVIAKTNHLLAQGINQTETASLVGLSREKVNKIAKSNKHDIEQLALRLIQKTIPIIEENHINTMRLANGLLKCDENSPQIAASIVQSGLDPKDIISISDKKEYRMMQVMGIVPSNTPSVILNQILGNVSVNLVDPGVRQLLGGQLDQLEDIQDAEVVE